MSANKPFTWQRIKRYPNSGEMFKSDGETFKHADYMAIKEHFDVDVHTASNGNIAILSIRLESLASATDHFFVIDIPTGKKFILSDRVLSVSGGRYFIDAIAITSFNPVGATTGIIAGMDKTRPVICDTRLRYTTSANITGASVREYGFIDGGSAQTGQSRVPSSTDTERHFKILSGPSVLRVRKTDDTAFTINLTYIGWEIDA